MIIVNNKNDDQVLYMNAGDWIENLTALEYKDKKWSIYRYEQDDIAQNLHLNYDVKDPEMIKAESKNKELFNDLLKEFDITRISK